MAASTASPPCASAAARASRRSSKSFSPQISQIHTDLSEAIVESKDPDTYATTGEAVSQEIISLCPLCSLWPINNQVGQVLGIPRKTSPRADSRTPSHEAEPRKAISATKYTKNTKTKLTSASVVSN